jgi:hypothetical protein
MARHDLLYESNHGSPRYERSGVVREERVADERTSYIASGGMNNRTNETFRQETLASCQY